MPKSYSQSHNMATATISETQPSLKLQSEGRLRIDGTDPTYGDWRDDLVRDGFAVIKGAVPRERALQYADKMMALLESL